MKAFILYESFFGNTEAVARSMGKYYSGKDYIKVENMSDVTWEDVSDADLLIVGSPTRGFRPCEKTIHFLKSIPSKGLAGKRVAAFDTRIPLENINSKILRILVKIGGYAAPRISSALKKRGGEIVTAPEGFYVTGEKGPLAEGEEARAADWAKTIIGTG